MLDTIILQKTLGGVVIYSSVFASPLCRPLLHQCIEITNY